MKVSARLVSVARAGSTTAIALLVGGCLPSISDEATNAEVVAATTLFSAQVGVASVVVAGFIGIVGTVAGGLIAQRSANKAAEMASEQAAEDRKAAADLAQEDRIAERELRRRDRMLDAAVKVIALAERHKDEVWNQARGRQRVFDGKAPEESIPDVGPLDDVVDEVGVLYATARKGTADAAWDIYVSLRYGLDQFVYDAEKDKWGGTVRGVPDEMWRDMDETTRVFGRAKTVFLDQVRDELGLEKLQTEPLPGGRGEGGPQP
jgi:hypothetical protein